LANGLLCKDAAQSLPTPLLPFFNDPRMFWGFANSARSRFGGILRSSVAPKTECIPLNKARSVNPHVSVSLNIQLDNNPNPLHAPQAALWTLLAETKLFKSVVSISYSMLYIIDVDMFLSVVTF
jgi:hypothetical protein